MTDFKIRSHCRENTEIFWNTQLFSKHDYNCLGNKNKNGKCVCIKLKSFCFQKIQFLESRDNTQMGELSHRYSTDKGLTFRIFKSKIPSK
jgi:hypothetical protein